MRFLNFEKFGFLISNPWLFPIWACFPCKNKKRIFSWWFVSLLSECRVRMIVAFVTIVLIPAWDKFQLFCNILVCIPEDWNQKPTIVMFIFSILSNVCFHCTTSYA